jgi:hypothetical protein
MPPASYPRLRNFTQRSYIVWWRVWVDAHRYSPPTNAVGKSPVGALEPLTPTRIQLDA